jgi:hypothetical protein
VVIISLLFLLVVSGRLQSAGHTVPIDPSGSRAVADDVFPHFVLDLHNDAAELADPGRTDVKLHPGTGLQRFHAAGLGPTCPRQHRRIGEQLGNPMLDDAILDRAIEQHGRMRVLVVKFCDGSPRGPKVRGVIGYRASVVSQRYTAEEDEAGEEDGETE